MATATRVKLTSEMQYLNDAIREGRAVLQDKFSMKALGNPDPAFQPRVVHLNMDHVDTLKEVYHVRGKIDPVTIFRIIGKKPSDDLYILVDGFHRHEVYKRAGEVAIPAYVIEGTVEDAIEYAAMANQYTLLKRNKEDIKKQIYMLLKIPDWFKRTDTEVGRHVGITAGTAKKYRLLYCKEKDMEPPSLIFENDITRIQKRKNTLPKKPPINITPDGKFVCEINKRKLYLGDNLQDAKRNLDEKFGRIIQRTEILHIENLGSWLRTRGIVLRGPEYDYKRYRGIGRAFHGYGRVVITARLEEPGAIFTAIGRLYALRHILQEPDQRLVMVCVCYPEDGRETLVQVARDLGVELLTPEEFVASVKGEQADDE
jgi:hypothetical protein